MASGVDRYFQIAKCFRDEDLGADKQPEFTQIDMEMSFVDSADVMRVMESIVKRTWKRFLGMSLDDFPVMKYEEAIRRVRRGPPSSLS